MGAEVRRRWRILGMKIKFGLGTQALAVKRGTLRMLTPLSTKSLRKPLRKIRWTWRASVWGRRWIRGTSEEEESGLATPKAEMYSKENNTICDRFFCIFAIFIFQLSSFSSMQPHQ